MYSLIVALIGIVVLLVFLVVAIYVGMRRERSAAPVSESVLHKSGIYSVVRKSPAAMVSQYKPSEAEIKEYLNSPATLKNGAPLSNAVRAELQACFKEQLGATVAEIEAGDRDSAEFYYYTFNQEDRVCSKFIKKGRFVTREEIYRHPQVLPPFHLGCSCEIKAYKGSENLHKTTELNMFPFFKDGAVPKLPDWKAIG